MSDNLEIVFSNFFKERNEKLVGRFPTPLRAIVVETNDPLNMHRVRVKIPELHDFNLKPEECPWANPDVGWSSTTWFSPSIGDWLWVEFEKNHPYAPIYHGSADPNRIQAYALEGVYVKSPAPINAQKDVEIPIAGGGTYKGVRGDTLGEAPIDYNEDYLPKDGRPMSQGVTDSYGNVDLTSATGFFPLTHDIEPPAPEIDPFLSQDKTEITFNVGHAKPIANNPDSKFMMRLTKYGNIILQGDQGYRWRKKKDDGDTTSGQFDGEFLGDVDKDRQFEIDRWKYLQRLIHEDKPTALDQRRIMMQTRYGNKLELRDVGWNKTRAGEYTSDQRWIGSGANPHNDNIADHWGYTDSDYKDQRWIKFRTKGGHLFQASDVGLDPEKDVFASRNLINEVSDIDSESKFGADARFVRIVTRSGIKFVLDDRGSNTRNAQDVSMNNANIGTGVLIKGRRVPASLPSDQKGGSQDSWTATSKWVDIESKTGKSGTPVGYYWQIDERVDFNHTVWGSPLGSVIEINDKDEYIAICQRLPDLPTKWKYLDDNEFLTTHVADPLFDFQTNTHHLAINHRREYIRLKTRAGRGSSPDSIDSDVAVSAQGEHQGIEMHDGPTGKSWAEIVDMQGRGFWFSEEQQMGIWRARTDTNKQIAIWLDDSANQVVLRNNEVNGKIQIYCIGDVEIIANRSVAIQSSQSISLQAPNAVNISVGGAIYNFTSNGLNTNKNINAAQVFAKHEGVIGPGVTSNGTSHASAAGGVSVSAPTPATKNIIAPTNRAK